MAPLRAVAYWLLVLFLSPIAAESGWQIARALDGWL